MMFRTYRPSIGSAIFGLLVFIGVMYLLFKLAQLAFQVLIWVGPVLLIAALIIDYRVVLDYLKWIGTTLRQRPLLGILFAILTVVAYPVVCAYLFAKALLRNRLKNVAQEMKDRAEASGPGRFEPPGRQNDEFDEVVRGDGMRIRIPREQS